MLSVPVIKKLAFWHGTFSIDKQLFEVKAGFWGACTFKRNLKVNDKDRKRPSERDEDVSCTKAKAGYSFELSSTVPDARGKIHTTQTLFFFWLFLATVLALSALGLSFSPNYYQWKQATILSMVSSALSFGVFLACVVMFTGLSREIRKTESAKTIPLMGQLEGCTFFPLMASVFLGMSAACSWICFKQEFVKRSRNSTERGRTTHQLEFNSRNPNALPPPTLNAQGMNRVFNPGQINNRGEAGAGGPKRSFETFDNRDNATSTEESYGSVGGSEADDEGEENGRESVLSQSNYVENSSFSDVHSSNKLPPPPPLLSHR
ncbi:hypothetical protein O181_001413 [Austropuccinia psidii MF-1]|uniref:Uncharacterized protein n=1 Tax=Austropuccinia psidii MF-1 TaxID=1389203 RepID=A0A9Q3BAQ6_9BASI|nr:hypothetical protein [Austropuccinia psidii MF-1]